MVVYIYGVVQPFLELDIIDPLSLYREKQIGWNDKCHEAHGERERTKTEFTRYNMMTISYCTALSTVRKYKMAGFFLSENNWNKYN